MIKKINQENFYWFSIGCAFLWFLFQTVYFVLSIKQAVYPDENYHMSLIMLYHSAFGFQIEYTSSTYFLGDIQHIPYLYHLFLGKILHFNIFPFSDYLFLRITSLIINFGTIIFSFLTFRLLTKNKSIHILTLGILVNLLYYMFMSASISYDVAVNFFTAGSIYFLFHFFKEKNKKSLFFFFLFLLWGSLSKITFLPITLILNILFLFGIFQKNIHITSLISKSRKGYFSLVVLIFFIGCNVSLYGKNLIKYGKTIPACHQVLTQEECSKNHFVTREANNNKMKKTHSFTPISYAFEWKYLVQERITGIASYQGICKNEKKTQDCEYKNEKFFWQQIDIFPSNFIEKIFSHIFLVSFFLFLLGALGYFLNVKIPWEKERITSNIFICIIITFFYTAVILFINYGGYYASGSVMLGIHGRYLFPILPLFCFLISYFLLNYTPKKITIAVFFFLLSFALWNGLPSFMRHEESKFLQIGKYEKILPKGPCSAQLPECGELNKEEWKFCKSEKTWQCLRDNSHRQ